MNYASIKAALQKSWPIVCAVILFALFWTVQQAFAGDSSVKQGERLVTIYDRGQEQTIVTKATTVRDVLREAKVQVSDIDITEPAVETEISGRQYNVNVYRARPVVVEDGATRARVMTAAQGPVQIAKAADVTLYAEDNTKMERVNDVLADGGAGLKMVIERATPFEFVLYGKPVEARTQAKTVGEMLKEKDVVLGPDDGVSPAASTPITAGMKVSVWRNGVQTVTVEEKVSMPVHQIHDMDKPIGYRFVKEEGKAGTKQVTYVIEMRDGKEVKRKKIQSVVTEKPIEQVEIVGAKNNYSSSLNEWLLALRTCETGNNYSRNSGNGYYGAYQFLPSTWDNIARMSGRNDLVGVLPSKAAPADQDAMVIANTNATAGLSTQHPGCYAKLGLSNKPPAR